MQSIGERLEEARKRKGISIREAAEATKIRSDYLHKFENNQYDIKLPEIYVRGFLRTYSNFLKLPGEKIINDYNALGLNEAKPRQLSRELYGRMDLTVAPKTEKPPTKERPAAAVEEPAEEPAHRNPATFIPQPSGRSIDPAMLWRIGAIALGGIVILVLLIWLLFGRSSSEARTSTTTNTTSAPAEVWQRPQSGDTVITLVAKAAVNVSVTREGVTIYQGNIPAGETRIIPWRGALRVTADPFQNLEFEISGKRHPMPNQRVADIRAPSN